LGRIHFEREYPQLKLRAIFECASGASAIRVEFNLPMRYRARRRPGKAPQIKIRLSPESRCVQIVCFFIQNSSF
jgi:hypothetical protein